MATVNVKNSKPIPMLANWTNAAEDRELPVWQVAVLSMGFDPTTKNLETLKLDESTYEDYLARKRYLGKRLRETPAPGYIHWLSNHPYNRSRKGAFNRMVDVVSCIEVMSSSNRFQLVAEFLGLLDALLKRPLYTPDRPVPGVVIEVPSVKQNVAVEKIRTTSATTRINEKNALLVFALAVSGYKYDPSGSKTQKENIVEVINASLVANGFTANGLGTFAIQSALDLGEAIALKKGVDV